MLDIFGNEYRVKFACSICDISFIKENEPPLDVC